MKVLLIGCGKMGEALLAGWLSSGIEPGEVQVVEKNTETAERLQKTYRITVLDALTADALVAPDVAVLAVKPQHFETVLAECSETLPAETCYLSIAAGKSIASILQGLSKEEGAVIRAMPNLPATISQGITGLVASEACEDAQKDHATSLMEGAGEVVWIEDEALMDMVTAISGSGPAYIFHVAEVLEQAAIQYGLPEDVAKLLARQTVVGSAALLGQSDQTSTQLREAVTSPGGTTEAALNVLMQDEALYRLFADAIKAAENRGKELNS